MLRRSLLLAPLASPLHARPRAFFETDLFQAGDAGVHTYRIPALVETRRGILIAACDARHDSAGDLPGRISIVFRRSHDQGRTWTQSQTLRAVETGGAGDPSLLVDRRTGRIWCFHAYGPPGVGFPQSRPGPDTLQVHAVWSDDGATWSAARDLTPQVKDPAWQAMFPTSGTHPQLRRGRYLVPMVVRHGDGMVAARNAYSDDAGLTWRIGPAIGRETDESHAVELPGGEVMQNLRSRTRKARAVAISRDGGVTFGEVTHNETLVDPNCNAGIVRAGRRLVFTNAASTRRERLTVWTSADSGRTWPQSRVLHPGPAAYSTVIALGNGDIAVLYERDRRITFATFPPNWVSGQ